MSSSARRAGVVVGNPKPQSRTLDVGVAVLRKAAEAVGLALGDELVVDLATVGAEVLDWSSERVRGLVDAVSGCSLLVVASPTFKASYTGLLKCFLDWFGTTGLSGAVTVPVMIGAGPAHALAVEVHLRPVLVEIGATLPTRGLNVTEPDLARLYDVIGVWLEEAAPALRRALGQANG